MDPYLIEDSSEQRFSGLITDGSTISFAAASSSSPSSSSGSGSASSSWSNSFPSLRSGAPAPNRNQTTSHTRNPLIKASGPVTSSSSSGPVVGSIPPTATATANEEVKQEVAEPTRFQTLILKSPLGLGLELSRCKRTNRARIARFKDFNGQIMLSLLFLCENSYYLGVIEYKQDVVVENPALLCSPALHVGDVIVSVDQVDCPTFDDAVARIRDVPVGAQLVLSLLRFE